MHGERRTSADGSSTMTLATLTHSVITDQHPATMRLQHLQRLKSGEASAAQTSTTAASFNVDDILDFDLLQLDASLCDEIIQLQRDTHAAAKMVHQLSKASAPPTPASLASSPSTQQLDLAWRLHPAAAMAPHDSAATRALSQSIHELNTMGHAALHSMSQVTMVHTPAAAAAHMSMAHLPQHVVPHHHHHHHHAMAAPLADPSSASFFGQQYEAAATSPLVTPTLPSPPVQRVHSQATLAQALSSASIHSALYDSASADAVSVATLQQELRSLASPTGPVISSPSSPARVRAHTVSGPMDHQQQRRATGSSAIISPPTARRPILPAQPLPVVKDLGSNTWRRKRQRRSAAQLQRLNHCPMNDCDKRYEAWRSLQHHLNLKHGLRTKQIDGRIIAMEGSDRAAVRELYENLGQDQPLDIAMFPLAPRRMPSVDRSSPVSEEECDEDDEDMALDRPASAADLAGIKVDDIFLSSDALATVRRTTMQ